MHDRKKLQKLWNQIPGEGWLHSPVLQVQRVKWRSSSLVWLAVEVAAVNEEEEPQYILLDLWTHQPELLICSLGAGWRVARVCGGSDFSALIFSHHMMLNFCQWDTSFSLQNWPFLQTIMFVLLKVSPCLSVSHVAHVRESKYAMKNYFTICDHELKLLT